MKIEKEIPGQSSLTKEAYHSTTKESEAQRARESDA